MKVLKAEAMGFCFGVRDALAVADSIENPNDVTIHGELVHNPVVLEGLKTRGFPISSETQRDVPDTEQVLITAHGVSDRERSRLTSAGKVLVDTTCPLVARVHRTAATLERSGYHVIVIGKPGHVEVRGIVEDLSSYTVVPDIDDVTSYPYEKIGIVCQTTMPPNVVQQIRGALSIHNPGVDIRFEDTVCQPTRDRQNAMDRLLNIVKVVVVVGGRNSNNTRQLVRKADARGVRSIHVENAAEICPKQFQGVDVVGLTAGTSTPDFVIEQVAKTLEGMNTSGVVAAIA